MSDTTVVIPSTGSWRELLERALGSVHEQTRRVVAVVVVVDGDAATTRDVERRAGPSVQVVTTGGTSGVSVARNLGASVAKSPFVAFLDDDDRWKETFLEHALAAGEAFDVALAAFEKHSASGIRPEKVPPEVLTPDAFLVRNPGIRGSSIIIRRATANRSQQDLGNEPERGRVRSHL